MLTQNELIALVTAYDPGADREALARAYLFAQKAHATQIRQSGEPYFYHPVQVAAILTEMRLDTATIITALLHDTVEDTDITLEDIAQNFGTEVRDLVDGVTKLSQIEMTSKQHKQAENFRKLVLAMSNDIRVLLVKLADRLHNMRTLHHVSTPEKRKRIACETMEIYAPLAGRIGIHHFKDELQDLSFMHINPEARASIISRLQFLRSEDDDKVGQIIADLKALLEKSKVSAIVCGREKRPYSIWEKMQRKNITFEQLSDIMAFRIKTQNIPDCYQTLGIVHSAYRMVPERFKDYISTPKPNGYQSLHTTVYGPRNHRVEIQIRTESMHRVNEYGVSAHWEYKQGAAATQEGDQYRWLRGLLDILENASDPEDFLEHTKLEMFQDQVFCFTPGGDLITLPQGATSIDFAYAIHSEVGNRCVGARINGRMAPLRTPLKNGDQVEISTARAQTPSPSWERYTVTGKAKAAIRRFVRSQKRAQFSALGHSILQKIIKTHRASFTERQLEEALPHFECRDLDDLYALIGEGVKNAVDVVHYLCPPEARPQADKSAPPPRLKKNRAAPLSIQGLIPGMAVHYAGCCHPLPGDSIVGVMKTGHGVTIHTMDCENLKNYRDEPDRVFDLVWSEQDKRSKEKFIGRLHLIAIHKVGSMANIATMIGKHEGNIMNFKVLHRTDTFFEFLLDIEVQDVAHLKVIMANLRSSDYVNSVERQAY